MDDEKMSVIHFVLPTRKKSAYVREARKNGQKLVPWVMETLDRACELGDAMVDKRGWHKCWREENGQRIHDSGLVLEYQQNRWQPVAASLATFATHEAARGVPAHHLEERLQRLCREAAMWVNRDR